MNFQIKRISDCSVALMTEQGHVLAYFTTVTEALVFCEQWYQANENERCNSMAISHKVA